MSLLADRLFAVGLLHRETADKLKAAVLNAGSEVVQA